MQLQGTFDKLTFKGLCGDTGSFQFTKRTGTDKYHGHVFAKREDTMNQNAHRASITLNDDYEGEATIGKQAFVVTGQLQGTTLALNFEPVAAKKRARQEPAAAAASGGEINELKEQLLEIKNLLAQMQTPLEVTRETVDDLPEKIQQLSNELNASFGELKQLFNKKPAPEPAKKKAPVAKPMSKAELANKLKDPDNEKIAQIYLQNLHPEKPPGRIDLNALDDLTLTGLVQQLSRQQ